jgi:dihydrofolate reductase
VRQPIIIIAAMTTDRVIGDGDGMPWDIPAEYQQYLAQVSQETMIMGRRSFEIFGHDIPQARKIVISRSTGSFASAERAGSLPEAIRLARQTSRTIFIGGGASIYRESLEIADRMHLSVVKGKYTGDTYFPPFDLSQWRVAVREPHAEFEYFEYERANKAPHATDP